MTHSFGISLVYPGSMAFMRMLIEKPLMEGRTKLFLEHGGERFKVATQDGNKIDTMFVDQRSKNSGSTLVLCCEGNAAFFLSTEEKDLRLPRKMETLNLSP